jgi:hypothetical protein
VGHAASLLKVFLPYLVWNTVFDNRRVVAELGCAPAKFSSYCFPLFRFAQENHFRYPFRDWPAAGQDTSRDASLGSQKAVPADVGELTAPSKAGGATQ